MAVLSAGQLTLADHAKRFDPNGSIAAVGELLSQTNEILEDAVFIEGNLPTGHRTTIRTGLPTVYWRALNQGVPPSKSTTAQVDEACGMLEARSHIDSKLAQLNGNTAAFRLSEDVAFIEAMNQTQASTLFYGNPGTDPKQYLGLAPRYSSLSAGNADNIINGQGAGSDNTSIYLVVWGENTVFCPFPKGSQAGLSHRDLGEESVSDGNGGFYQALRTLYQWDNGLVVKDWRYVVRIANIDVSNLVGESSAADVIKLMAKALDRIPNLNMGRAAFYMNRTVHSMLRIQAMTKASSVLAPVKGLNQFGNSTTWTEFDGVPLRKTDGILNTEALVS
ncbi:hypothetical protein BSL82_10155 [Tardibacter chloracetimidivorans]|uniref:Major capsid protein n=1 Tax=Tardibacter chloracetimidivorans TaxID=1921510 RepID=A0A1L3ZVJ4_9SPHN|nr:hypothetical protein [Tardibacter chloracetimidivorans]API59635.1 hypothetical protein BSL82_10155 [Tardibacter chloracetimidivorans]